jgi:hypothetical protein
MPYPAARQSWMFWRLRWWSATDSVDHRVNIMSTMSVSPRMWPAKCKFHIGTKGMT